jgi:hypothetical protein
VEPGFRWAPGSVRVSASSPGKDSFAEEVELPALHSAGSSLHAASPALRKRQVALKPAARTKVFHIGRASRVL